MQSNVADMVLSIEGLADGMKILKEDSVNKETFEARLKDMREKTDVYTENLTVQLKELKEKTMEKETITQKLDALLNICVDKKTFGEKCNTFVEKSVLDEKLQ